MSPAVLARLRLGGLLVLALVLQTTVVPDLRILGVCADLLLLCTVCAALVGGPELGGLVGFAAGLLADLFLTTTPLGLSALAFSVVGYAVGSVRRTVLQEGWLLAPATALVASTAGVIIFVLAGAMIGQSQLTRVGPVDIVKTALLVGVMNAVIAAPVCRVVGWAASASQGSPGSMGSALGSAFGSAFGGSLGSHRAGQAGSEISSTAARHSSRLASRPAHIRAGRGGGRGR
ncbi:MAG: rod shape-determining protein MreD [Acidimicrobiaceae bacterium]|jgi:rod shape-determining protein MreD|nr:rod shape-determining protein MreD [Acidimicrobiaceae bacterium]